MSDIKRSRWEKFWLNKWMAGTVIFLLLAVISFFQINSWWADQHHFNGIFGWLGIGIVLGLVGLYCAYKTATTSTGTGG
jgi:membrane protein DedA with SNARE-associated domain